MERKKTKTEETLERLEKGMEELFESEKYQTYLSTMAKFHSYSINNTLLIALQKPEATFIAGYQDWQRKFHRQVKSGEKGIVILAPCPQKYKEVREMIDEDTGLPVLDAQGKVRQEEIEVVQPGFRPVFVFDYSQTTGPELPGLGLKELTGEVERYEELMHVLTEVAPVPVIFDHFEGEAKGYFSPAENRIVVQKGMSQAQTLKTLIHETAHSLLHGREILVSDVGDEKKDRKTKEVEAESVAYVVSERFGLDTSEYSFGYIAGWSSGRSMKELKGALTTIRKTSDSIIALVEEKLKQKQKQEGREEAKEHGKENDCTGIGTVPSETEGKGAEAEGGADSSEKKRRGKSKARKK